MRVHDIERHLDGLELEAAFARNFEHVKVDARIFVAGEADVTQLARLLCGDQSGIRPIVIEDAMRVFVAKNFVVLNEVDAIHFHAAK